MKNNNTASNFSTLVSKVTAFFATVVLGKRTRTGLLNSKETASGNASTLNAYRVFDNVIRTYQRVLNSKLKEGSKLDVQKTSKLVCELTSLEPLFASRLVKNDAGDEILVSRDKNGIEKSKALFKSNLKRDMAIAFNFSDDAIAQMKTNDFTDKQVLAWLKVNAKFLGGLTEYVQPVKIIKATDAKAVSKPSAKAKERRTSAKSKVMTAKA